MTPLVLADGTKIDTNTGVVIDANRVDTTPVTYVEVPSHSEAVDIVVNTRRALVDLPASTSVMHPVAAVVSYKLFGLSNTDIAVALDTSEMSIQRVLDSDAYQEFYAIATQNLIEAHREQVRGLIETQAQTAVNTITRSLRSENESVALHAAKDILDRAGHTPAQIVDHRHSFENELRIVHVDRKRSEQESLVLDMEPIEVIEDGNSN